MRTETDKLFDKLHAACTSLTDNLPYDQSFVSSSPHLLDTPHSQTTAAEAVGASGRIPLPLPACLALPAPGPDGLQQQTPRATKVGSTPLTPREALDKASSSLSGLPCLHYAAEWIGSGVFLLLGRFNTVVGSSLRRTPEVYPEAQTWPRHSPHNPPRTLAASGPGDGSRLRLGSPGVELPVAVLDRRWACSLAGRWRRHGDTACIRGTGSRYAGWPASSVDSRFYVRAPLESIFLFCFYRQTQGLKG